MILLITYDAQCFALLSIFLKTLPQIIKQYKADERSVSLIIRENTTRLIQPDVTRFF